VATVVGGFLLNRFEVIPLGRWISTIGRWLVRPFHVPLIVFVVIVAALALFVVRFVGTLKEPLPPPWIGYREDTFLDVVWRWQYDGHRLDEHSIGAFCPRCQMRLRVEAGGYRTVMTTVCCEDCGFRHEVEGNPKQVLDRVERLIEREANRRAQAVR